MGHWPTTQTRLPYHWVTSRFINVEPQDIKIKYLDDEKNFVNLAYDDASVSELFRCAVPVENADFKRITILIEESNSPLPPPFPRRCERKRTCELQLSPASMPSLSKKEQKNVTTRKSLDFQSPVPAVQMIQNKDFGAVPFKSPLEHYLEHQRHKLLGLETKARKLSECVASYHPAGKKSFRSENVGPMCSNCHKQEGHNRLNCPYNACVTSFHCGAINKHPGEKSQLKEYEKQLQDVKKEMSSVQKELDVKQAASKSIQQRYVYQVRHCLIESDPDRYLVIGDEGHRIENWFLLNQDAKKLEVMLKGKLPAQHANIKELLAKASVTDSEDCMHKASKKTSVRNPYKKLWKDRGVEWPNEGTNYLKYSPGGASTMYTLKAAGQDYACGDDDYRLAVGIQESLQMCKDEDIDYRSAQPRTTHLSTQDKESFSVSSTSSVKATINVYTDQECKSTESASSNKHSDTDSNLDGLSALVEACRTVSNDF